MGTRFYTVLIFRALDKKTNYFGATDLSLVFLKY